MIKTKTAITFLLVCASSVAISFTTSASKDTAEEESYYESVIETMNNKEAISTIRESKHVEREIEEDLTGFVDDFNHSDYLNDVVLRNVENKEEYALDATSIEYSNSVYIIEKEIYGTYLDFNEDNGYAVIGSNRTIYEVQIEGDLEELRDGQDLLYSTLDGFVYFDENNVCQRMFENLEPSYMDAIDDKDEIDETDLDYYVATPEMGNYIYTESTRLATKLTCYNQYQTSYYRQVACNKKGVPVTDDSSIDGSESNCSPTAMFHVISSWAQNGKISGVDYTSTTDISEIIRSDDNYKKYITKGTIYKDSSTEYHYWRVNDDEYLKAMPSLYINIRNIASDKGFTPEGGFMVSKVDNVLESVVESYGTTISASSTSSISEAIYSINRNRAVYMSIRNSNDNAKYEKHGVALLGYQMYTYVSSSGSYSEEKNIYYLLIADGWVNEIVTYNPADDYDPTLKFVVWED